MPKKELQNLWIDPNHGYGKHIHFSSTKWATWKIESREPKVTCVEKKAVQHTISRVFFASSLINGNAIGGISGVISDFFRRKKVCVKIG
jgi:hypothetical protein